MELHWALVTFGDCHLVTSPLSCVVLLSAVEIQQVFTWEGATYIFVKKDKKTTKFFFFPRPVERRQVMHKLRNKAEAELGRGLGAEGGQRHCRSALGRQSYPAG